MVSLKLLLIKTVEDIVVFQGINVFDFDYSYIISCIRNAQVTFVKKPAQLRVTEVRSKILTLLETTYIFIEKLERCKTNL